MSVLLQFARAGVAVDEVVREGIASDGLSLSTLASVPNAVAHPALAPFVQRTTLRNPVDGLAGGTDKFNSVDDVMTSFGGLGWLHQELLPTVDFEPAVSMVLAVTLWFFRLMVKCLPFVFDDNHGLQEMESGLFDGSWKNAYIYDYWKHGNANAIKEENSVNFSQLYDAFKLMNRNMQVNQPRWLTGIVLLVALTRVCR
jgi:hypothetical protein